MSRRFVVECVWSGYHSGQRHPVHREVTLNPKRYEGITGVVFTDGTTMSVVVRPCEPREKVREIHGYGRLLNDAAALGLKGYVRVADLPK